MATVPQELQTPFQNLAGAFFAWEDSVSAVTAAQDAVNAATAALDAAQQAQSEANASLSTARSAAESAAAGYTYTGIVLVGDPSRLLVLNFTNPSNVVIAPPDTL